MASQSESTSIAAWFQSKKNKTYTSLLPICPGDRTTQTYKRIALDRVRSIKTQSKVLAYQTRTARSEQSIKAQETATPLKLGTFQDNSKGHNRTKALAQQRQQQKNRLTQECYKKKKDRHGSKRDIKRRTMKNTTDTQ